MAICSKGKFMMLFRSHFFRLAQKFSIGLKSGEYAGRNRRFTPYFSAIRRSDFFLWKLALSMMTVYPQGTTDSKSNSNQSSKSAEFVVLEYVLGAKTLPLQYPETTFVLAYFRPRFVSSTLTPRRARPCVLP